MMFISKTTKCHFPKLLFPSGFVYTYWKLHADEVSFKIPFRYRHETVVRTPAVPIKLPFSFAVITVLENVISIQEDFVRKVLYAWENTEFN